MKIPLFSITGMQHKRFDDGVDIFVHYTRLDTNIRMINSVRFAYNYSILEQKYDNTYNLFLSISRTVVVGGKHIDVVPRVREMMGEVELELRSMGTDDMGTGRSLVDANNGIIPAHTAVQTDEHPTSANINILDDTGNLLAEIPISSVNTTIKPPAPKRKRTRWELLELD